jgi:protoheme IX farnesyltransferase
MTTQTISRKPSPRIAQYWALTKPRVTSWPCFVPSSACSGHRGCPTGAVVFGTVGIWLLAGAAFAVNCLAEREIDARMARTARRPMAWATSR